MSKELHIISMVDSNASTLLNAMNLQWLAQFLKIKLLGVTKVRAQV